MSNIDIYKAAEALGRAAGGANLTEDEIRLVCAAGLSLFNQRDMVVMGEPMFTQYLGAGDNHCAEAVALRINRASRDLEVRLVFRPANSPAFPEHFSVPGTWHRKGETWDDVLKRLEQDFDCIILNRQKLGEITHQDPRGWTTSRVYLVELADNSTDEGWFSVEAVLAGTVAVPTIPTHKTFFVPIAVAAFKARESEGENGHAARQQDFEELKKKYFDNE